MHHKNEPYILTQVILKPHALNTLFGINASALTDGVVDLREFSTPYLHEQLTEANSQQERIGLLTRFLLNQVKQDKTRDKLVEEGLSFIHKSIGSVTVKNLIERLSISERQFERNFAQSVGVSPQFYIRVRRFNEAMRLMKSRRFKRLTDVAYALNYYDQSHFIRDVKALSGTIPRRLFQKAGDFHQDQGGYFHIQA